MRLYSTWIRLINTSRYQVKNNHNCDYNKVILDWDISDKYQYQLKNNHKNKP